MNKRQIALLLAAAVACIGCCALPLYALITGVISLTAAAVFTPRLIELLICLIPLILIAGFWLYRRHQQKRCCTTPSNNCSDSQCSIEHKP